MKPVTTGKVLIAIGCLLMFRALTMSISIGSFGGYEIPNIHLMNQRQFLLFLGGFLFIGGIVLYSANKTKQTKEQEEHELAAFEKEVDEKFRKFNEDNVKFVSRIKQIIKNYAIKISLIYQQYDVSQKIRRIATGLLVGVFAGVFFGFLISLIASKLLEQEMLSVFGYTFGIVLVSFGLNGLRDIPKAKYYRQLKIIFAISAITIVALLIVVKLDESNYPKENPPKPIFEQKPDEKPAPESLPERLSLLIRPISTT
jgi:hypothetical protein